MATKSFFTPCVITDKNKDKFFEMLRSTDKHPAASDKDFRKLKDVDETIEFIKGVKK